MSAPAAKMPGRPDQQRDPRPLLQQRAGGVQGVDGLLVDRVADLGPVETEHDPVVGLLDQEGAHASKSTVTSSLTG